MDHSEKLKLYGFNNLTKALSFNIYDVCYAKTPREQKDYIAYIDQQYNSERLTRILTSLTDMIGARVLSISLPIRNTIRRPVWRPSGWISTWRPAGRSRRFRHSIT